MLCIDVDGVFYDFQLMITCLCVFLGMHKNLDSCEQLLTSSSCRSIEHGSEMLHINHMYRKMQSWS